MSLATWFRQATAPASSPRVDALLQAVDVANGIVGTILLNLRPDVAPFELSMVAPTSKGRLIKIEISREGEGTFTIDGARHKATIFRVHPKLGGVAGVIAPMVGKDPKDVLVWVTPGSAPALVREVAQLAVGVPSLALNSLARILSRSKSRIRSARSVAEFHGALRGGR